jgi:hypothetical protein
MSDIKVPVDLTERVKEKLQLAFVELIPPEEWRDFVICEWKRFTTDTEPRYSGQPREPSPLKQLVRQYIEKKARQILEPLIDQYLEQQQFTIAHDDVQYLGNGLVRSAIHGFIAGMLESVKRLAEQAMLQKPPGTY